VRGGNNGRATSDEALPSDLLSYTLTDKHDTRVDIMPKTANPRRPASTRPSVHAHTRSSSARPLDATPLCFISGNLVDVDAVARTFGLTKASLAHSLGFAEDTLQRFSRAHAPKTQARLREFLEIIQRIEPWAGGPLQAIGWYRGYAIPALGDQTAEALVQHDDAALVRAYLDGFAAGGFA
jgi:hypothetical protein